MSDQPASPEMNTPAPLRLPPPPPLPPRRKPDTIVLRRSTVNYIAIATMFFVAGYIAAWAIFTTTTGALVADVKNEVSNTVGTQVAGLSAAMIPPVEPTATPIPRQTIDIGDAPSWGPENAKVTIVEFSDFECPYCRIFNVDSYKLLKQRYGDKVRYVFKDFPLNLHPNAVPAAMAARCANEQGKFWEYHEVLFPNQADLSETALIRYAGQVGVADQAKFIECLKTRKYQGKVQADLEYGISKFVSATPTFFINGYQLRGAPRSFEELAQYIDGLLAQTG